MATFESVRIEANAKEFPVLLSNGNFVESGDVEADGRHFAIWSGKRTMHNAMHSCIL